jgi:hypothetical protein
MERVVAVPLALIATAATGGCGGGSGHQQTIPPVTEQVRQALVASLQNPSLPAMSDAQRPRLPFTAVASCSGPDGGGAGQYRCVTTPRGSRGVRLITVEVKNNGQWSTQPLPVQARLHGRPTSAVTGLWGVGIELPK